MIVAKLGLLSGRFLDFLGDMSVSSVWEVLEDIREEVWSSVLHDHTSPLPRASKVSGD